MDKILDLSDHVYAKYNRRIGYTFHPVARIVSMILAFFSLGFAIMMPIFGIPILALLLYAASSAYGIQIQSPRGRFREYSSFLGIKYGKWLELDDYPDMAILTESSGYSTHSLSNRTTTDVETRYAVYFLSSSHWSRVEIKNFKTLEEARTFAKEMAMFLDKNYTTYNPKRSASTRRRR